MLNNDHRIGPCTAVSQLKDEQEFKVQSSRVLLLYNTLSVLRALYFRANSRDSQIRKNKVLMKIKASSGRGGRCIGEIAKMNIPVF